MSGRSRLRWAGRLDMYRKIPADLMEGTRRGSILSYCAGFIMILLFTMETRSYLKTILVTDLALDNNKEDRLRVNFNITMMDLRCEYAVVDVVSVLGTEQNVTAHVNKWHVDAAGVRRRYQGRNRYQKDIVLYDTTVETLDVLHENGVDAVELDPDSFDLAREQNEYVFVDFFAAWCSHCQYLAPTWETLAEVMTIVSEQLATENLPHNYTEEELQHAKKVQLPVMISKVDCVKHESFCRDQMIMAYPTLRLFVDGEKWKGGDYQGDRTVSALADYLKEIEDLHKAEHDNNTTHKTELAAKVASDRLKDPNDVMVAAVEDEIEELSEAEEEWAEKMKKRKRRLHHSWVEEEHPGCQLSGHLLLDRVPGNFHIQARSAHHDIAPQMTNVSHIVHSLSIGEPHAATMIEQDRVYAPPEVKRKIRPMDGNSYVTDNLHEAYHHYLKAITTSIDGLKFGRRETLAYQLISSSQLAYYREDVVPEAKFIFDLSPVAVSYRRTSRHWYDYITSLMAIIGGTFTVFGMLESSLNAVTTRKRW